jgi:hypothetical protein
MSHRKLYKSINQKRANGKELHLDEFNAVQAESELVQRLSNLEGNSSIRLTLFKPRNSISSQFILSSTVKDTTNSQQT